MGLVGCEASELFLYVWLWLLCQGTVQDGLSGCAKEPVLHGKTVPFTVQKALFCFSGAWGLLPSMVSVGSIAPTGNCQFQGLGCTLSVRIRTQTRRSFLVWQPSFS